MLKKITKQLKPTSNRASISSLKFHVRSDDYLATLSTVLNNIAQQKGNIEMEKDMLIDVARDLLYLQKFYLIRKRE